MKQIRLVSDDAQNHPLHEFKGKRFFKALAFKLNSAIGMTMRSK